MAADKRVIEFVLMAKDKMSGPFNVARGGINSLSSAVFSLKGLLVGLGVGVVAKQFLEAADMSEQLRVRMNVLLGSVKEGNALFDDMKTYAGAVPFEFEEIMNSATQLSGVLKGGRNEINEWMPLIGDLAAATGLSIQESTEQVSRMFSAGAASADKFRERGVLSMLGFQSGVSYSVEETKRMMKEAWTSSTSQFKGATEKLKVTWKGLMSMLSDKWFEFRNLLMDSGVMDFLKAIAVVINDYLAKSLAKATDNAAVFGETTIQYGFKMIEIIGWLADRIHDVKVAYHAIIAVFKKTAALFIDGYLLMLDAHTSFTRAVWNKKYEEPEFVKVLRIASKKANESFKETKETLREIAFKALPSEQIQKFSDDVKIALEKIKQAKADALANDKPRQSEFGGSGQFASTEEKSQLMKIAEENRLALEMDKETYEERLVMLMEQNLAEQEIAQLRYEEDLLMLENANMLLNLEEEQYLAAKLAITENYEKQMADARKYALQGSYEFGKAIRQMEIADMLSAGQQMLQTLASTNKTAFRIHKAMALAQALVSLPTAVIDSYKNGGGYPWGIVPATLMALTGAAQIAKINSTNFSGQAHAGLTNVPSEGTYLLQKGERVIPPEQNRDLTDYLSRGGGGSSGVTIENLNIHLFENATNASALLQMDSKELEEVVAQKVIPALNALERKGIKPDSVARMERT